MVETSKRTGRFQFDRGTGSLNTKRGNTDITFAPDPHHKERGAFRAIRALNRRELPQNQDMSNAILRSKRALDSNKSSLDDHGKLLVDDMNGVLDSFNRLLRSKNADGKLQRLTQTSGLEAKHAGKKTTEQARERKEEGRAARAEAISVFTGGKEVAVLLVRSPKFRSLLTELLTLVPKFTGRVTEKHGSELAQGLKRDSNRLRGEEDESETTGGSSTADVVRTLREEIRSGKVITEQEKTNLQNKFTEILKELSADERYKSTVNTVFGMIERYKPTRDRTRTGQVSSETTQMKRDTRNLLSEFVGHDAVDNFYDSFDDFVTLSRRNDEAMSFWRELRRLITDALNRPSMLDSDTERRRMRNVFDNGRRVFVNNDELYNSLRNLRESSTAMLNNIKEDSDLNYTREKIVKLMSDVTMGPDGRPNIDTILSSSRDIRSLVIPTLKQQLHSVPLPKITGRTSRFEFELENMTIDGRELLPDTFFLDTRAKLWVSANKLSANNAVYNIKFFVEDIRPRMHNFLYRVRSHKFPRIEDHGRASLDFDGRGISFLIKYELHYEQNRAPYIKVRRVNTNIDKMNIRIHDAKHKLIDRTVLKLFGGVIKRRLAKTAQARVYNKLRSLDDNINIRINKAYSSDQKNLINRSKNATNEAMGMAYDGSKKLRTRAKDYTDKVKRGGSRVRGMLREERQKPKTGTEAPQAPPASSAPISSQKAQEPTITDRFGSKQREASTIQQQQQQQQIPGSIS